MKLGIFGSRNLKRRKDCFLIKNEILKFQENNPIDFIVTAGEIEGACKHAREIGKELKIPLILYFYDMGKFHKGAFLKRTQQIIDQADCFLLFHDGESKGTKNELEMLKKQNKRYEYFLLELNIEDELFLDIDFDSKENWL